MATPTIEELYDRQIRARPREERRRLIRIAERDLEKEERQSSCDSPAPLDPTIALFAKWAEEDSTMTEEEMEAERASFEEFKAAINAERDRAGARRVF